MSQERGRPADPASPVFFQLGSEAFYPVTGDFPEQMNKAARILRAFTGSSPAGAGSPEEDLLFGRGLTSSARPGRPVDGIETSVETEVKGLKRQRKVLRKIPPEVLRTACGLAIFTSMRTAFSFIGGAGGAGVVVARLEDGSWSAPSSMSPNSLTVGLMIGVDIFDAVLVIRTPEALKSFASHKATLGSDIGVAAGPFGAGAAIEVGLEKAPVLSYVKSRGLYVGVQMVGQVFVERFEENEQFLSVLLQLTMLR
jgi:lipid-binding SYLF domain-containing protein